GQIGAKWNRNVTITAPKKNQADADDRSDERRQQDNGRQGLPAHPGAQGGQQLEIAIAHAFLARQQFEKLIHRPQRQITEDRSPDSVLQGGKQLKTIRDQAQPEQG